MKTLIGNLALRDFWKPVAAENAHQANQALRTISNGIQAKRPPGASSPATLSRSRQYRPCDYTEEVRAASVGHQVLMSLSSRYSFRNVPMLEGGGLKARTAMVERGNGLYRCPDGTRQTGGGRRVEPLSKQDG